MEHRVNEPPKNYFRSADRCFQMNGEWFFATREGIDVGPYATREAAAFAVARLIKMLQGIDDPIAAKKIIREFMYLMGKNDLRMP
jgi:hypothetical protein